MEPDFWHQRWRENAIAFHQETVNPYLVAHLARLGLAEGERIFVPLCGKSLDLHWLYERGFDVLGVELSPLALRAFFEEAGLDYRVMQAGRLKRYQHGPIRLLEGDFFDLEPRHVEGVRAIFDRASLVALPGEMRRRYARRLLELFPEPLPTLLVTFEYAQHEMDGPPFSVPEREVRALFEPACSIELLERNEVLDRYEPFREKGLTGLVEKVYRLA